MWWYPQAYQKPAERRGEIPRLSLPQPIGDRDQRSSDAGARTGARRQSPLPARFVRGNPLGLEPTERWRFLHPPAFPTSMTCWRLPCGLGSGETELTSLRIHLDLFSRLAEFIGMGRFFGTSDQATRGMQDLEDSFGWSGAAEAGQLGVPSHAGGRREVPEGRAHASNSPVATGASPQSAGSRGYPSGRREHDGPANGSRTGTDLRDHPR